MSVFCDNDKPLGVTRKSMRQNRLLQRSELGKTPRPISAPSAAHTMTHGVSSVYTDGGAAAAIGAWGPRAQSSKAGRRHSEDGAALTTQQRRAVPDFLKLNRTAVKRGLVTSTEQSRLRDQGGFDTRSRSSKHSATMPTSSSRKAYQAPPMPATHTYGAPNPDSAHVAELISAEPARRWREQELRKRKQAAAGSAGRQDRITHTKTTVLRQKVADPPAAPLWKLKRFDRAAPRVQTFRNSSSRDRAMLAHTQEGPSRLGAFSQGIYASGAP